MWWAVIEDIPICVTLVWFGDVCHRGSLPQDGELLEDKGVVLTRVEGIMGSCLAVTCLYKYLKDTSSRLMRQL